MNSDKQKTSKPFCSLAYLAKSTIAINANNGIRIINGNTNNNNNNNNDTTNVASVNSNMPNVAETARLKACASPELPTGAATTTTTTTATKGNHQQTEKEQIKSDYFGDINEEQPPQQQQQHQQRQQILQQKQQQRRQQQQRQQLQRQRHMQVQQKQQLQQRQQQQQQHNKQHQQQQEQHRRLRPWELCDNKLTRNVHDNKGNVNNDDYDDDNNDDDDDVVGNNNAAAALNDNVQDDNDDEDNGNDEYNDDDDDADEDVEDDLHNDEHKDYVEDIVDGGMLTHIPASLMPKHAGFAHNHNHHHNHHHHHAQNGNGGGVSGGLHSCLTSLQSRLSSLDCWDYTIELECLKGPQDLQLAAELGKTLLERNKELEILLKEHKTNNEEQEREIVHLRKQINAMSEVNDSRLKVYEQLEVGIQDLERTNHRLNVEKTRDKKQLKALTHSIETLESRCEELNKQLDETRQTLSGERRKNERLLQERNNARANQAEESNGGGGIGGVRLRATMATKQSPNGNEHELGFNANSTAPENCSFAFDQRNKANSTGLNDSYASHEQSLELSGGGIVAAEDNEELVKLVSDLESTKRAFMAEQQRCSELEEQLVAIIQENQTLQSRIAQASSNEEMMSMHDEFSILDEVRQGQMCSRCLRAVEDRATNNDEASSVAPTEDADEEDERSLLGLEGTRDNDNASELGSQAGYHTGVGGGGGGGGASGSGVSIKINPRAPDSLDLNAPASPNPYRDLVEKYEALLEVQRSSIARKTNGNNGNANGMAAALGGNAGGLSLAEEFQTSGDFNQTQKLMFQAAAAVVNAQVGIVGDVKDCTTVGAGVAGGADGASSCNDSINNEAASSAGKPGKSVRGRTPTEYSEAETSSSGYSDETSNKCTQTDERPGYFLCSIGDGEDCKFSIYDDVSPIDSRFRNRPEYRELFKEIFAVLKKAAENKEEGDKLPLLDDDTNAANAAAAALAAATTANAGLTMSTAGNGPVCGKVPPVTPANEELPVDFGDDTQSIISSAVSEQSFAMSECITKLERKTAKKHIIECRNQENKPPMSASIAQLAAAPAVSHGHGVGAGSGVGVGVGIGVGAVVGGKQIIENGRVLTPFKREPLEYLSIGVGIKKKNRRKNRAHNSGERVESPLALPTPPRFFVANSGASGSSRRGRKDLVPMSDMAGTGSGSATPTTTASGGGRGVGRSNSSKYEWNGSPMVIYNRNLSAARGIRSREFELNGVEYRPNTVSQEFHKLKKLDLSYAEVLRRADACEHHHQQQRAQRQQQQRRRTGNNVNSSHHHHH